MIIMKTKMTLQSITFLILTLAIATSTASTFDIQKNIDKLGKAKRVTLNVRDVHLDTEEPNEKLDEGDNFGGMFSDGSHDDLNETHTFSMYPDDYDELTDKLPVDSTKKLKCHACDTFDCTDAYICKDALKCWSASIRDSNGLERLARGCIDSLEKIDLMCKTSKHAKANKAAKNHSAPDYSIRGGYHMKCCDEKDYCNDEDFPSLDTLFDDEGSLIDNPNIETQLSVIIIISMSTILFLTTMAWFAIKYFRRSNKKRRAEFDKVNEEEFYQMGEDLQAKAVGDSTLKEYIGDGSVTSGSGSGLPLLMQRTLAKNLDLQECIGKGRYGEVWRAKWNCGDVAVKVFSTRDESSWIRETEIYSTVMLRHDNILAFFGSDMISKNSTTQLWLVTQFHSCGSLYDYLNRRHISIEQLLKFSSGIANGLAFLHFEIVASGLSRPGIAHRDIKSKNILVAKDTCVIADFGMAVTHKHETGELNVYPNPKVGTRRYMAPEVLDDSIKNTFDGFKRVDIYAFGLVLWEMGRRTSPFMEEYQPPFFDAVPPDPSFDEMRKVVCNDGVRPNIPSEWSHDPILVEYSKWMRECWSVNPMARHSALRVKKSIDNMEAHYEESFYKEGSVRKVRPSSPSGPSTADEVSLLHNEDSSKKIRSSSPSVPSAIIDDEGFASV